MSDPRYLIIQQTAYYAIVMVLTMMGVTLLLRGYLWSYIKVRTSFGKYVMVKIRSPLRDYFKVGLVDNGFLVYKTKIPGQKDTLVRLIIPSDKKVFYKCLNVNWVDVDEEKGSISLADYSMVEGFDAIKFENLHIRALTGPKLGDNREKMLMIMIIACLVGVGICVYLSYMNGNRLDFIVETTSKLLAGLKGSVTQSPI